MSTRVNDRNGRVQRFGRSVVRGACVVLGACGIAQGAAILEVYNDSLITYLPSSASAVQDIRPLANQRGVNLDGSLRAGSTIGLRLNGNPLGAPWSGAQRIGGVRLDIGTYDASAVDLSMPAEVPWVIGRSYNSRQQTSGGSARHSAGYQGQDWFQSSQPEIVYYTGATGADDVIYMVYGADRYIELHRTGSTSNEFKAVNGGAGIIQFAAGTTGEPDTYTYHDQVNTQVVFFGFDGDAGAAAGQIWKVIATDNEVAYVGDASTGSTAISSGYDGSGRILYAYDSSDRRFTYTYTTVDGATRLESVEAETKTSGTWASPSGVSTVGLVEYAYYATGSTTYGDSGYLKQVVRTVPMSSGPDQVLKTYYRYDASGTDLLAMIVQPEGVRAFDWAGDSTFDNDQFTASNNDLDLYASAEFSYDGSNRIDAIAIEGVCGCGGQNGLHTFDYGIDSGYAGTSSSGYDEEECTYTIVGLPAGYYQLQYFDETGQPLTRITTTTEPLQSGSPNTWIQRVDRYPTAGNNPGGSVEAILPPSEAGSWNDTSGTYSYSASGLANEQGFEVETATAALYGQPKIHKYYSGGSAASTTTTATSAPSITFGSTPLNAVSVDSVTRPDGQMVSRTVTFWSSGDAVLRPQIIETENPSVSTATNGPNTSTSSFAYHRKDGSTAFTVDPSGVYTYTQRSGGLIVKSIRDAKTNGTFASGDDPYTDFNITESSVGLDLTTTYAYDAVGRSDTVTAPDGNVSKTSYVCLADGQMATIRIPLVSGSNYYGPASVTVTNQARRVTASGTLAFSGGYTTTAPSGWLDTGEYVLTDAVLTGTLARLTVNTYEESGTRVVTSSQYFDIPGSGLGVSGTNYDRTTYDYDGAGRKVGVLDPTGTITRTYFDAIGRYSFTEVGTCDGLLVPIDLPNGITVNMTTVSEVVYDGSASPVSNKDSLVTKRTAVAGSGLSDRDTTYLYDGRNRVVVTVNPQAPHSVVKYDSSNRVVATGLYSSSAGLTASTDPTSTTTNRVGLTETAYDEMGRVYKTTRHEISQSSGSSTDTLVTETWYDSDGRVAKVAGAQLTKMIYDRVGRVTNRFVLAKDNDSTYANAVTDGVDYDTVLTEDQTYYDDYGKPLMRASIARYHDDTSGTGALDLDSDLSKLDYTNSKINGWASITSYWYDTMNRLVDTVQLGTFGGGGGSDYDRDSYGSAHARSDTALRTTTTFNDDGTVASTTDPAGRVTAFTYDDEGRRLKTINNYVDGTAGGGTNGDEDQITEAGYTDGLQTSFTAYVPGGSNQVTTYTYGVTTADSPGASKFASGRLLRQVAYPDSGGSSDTVRYAYNAQGQLIFKQDQGGNVVQTDHDTAGRVTAQRVTTVGSGFDGSVQAIRTAYDALGRVSTITQYDDPSSTSSGDVTDQIGYAYDDWGNLITFEQDVNSEIATNGDQWIVTEAWDKATGGARTLRRTQEVLQRWQNSGGWSLVDARDVRFDYGSSGGIDDSVSRVQTVQEQVGMSTVDLATYRYLGSGRVVGTTYPEPSEDIVSNLHGTTTGDYPSLDNFGRIVTSSWFKDHSAGDLVFYDDDVTYDRLGQVTVIEDNVYSGRDVSVTLDGLSRVIQTEEGTWGGSSISSRTRQQIWDLDSIGNWSQDQVDLNGDGDFVDAGEHDVSNTFNAANEQTARGGASLTWDAVGNLTDDGETLKYVYDPFGRLVQIKNQSSNLVSQQRYNGLGYRIAWQYDLDADGTVETSNSNDDPWVYFVYDSSWRAVASVFAVDDGVGFEAGEYLADADDEPREVFVFHCAGLNGRGTQSKLDDVILRDRDANTTWGAAGDGTCEERTYYCQNWRGDVVATLDDTGGRRETIRYSAYGVPFGILAGDINGDGSVTVADSFLHHIGEVYGDPGYNTRLDVNLDGTIDSTDSGVKTAQTGMSLGHGKLSQGPDVSGAGNRAGYAGYAWEPSTSKYHVRHRVLDPLRGRWSWRDPVGYVDSPTLYSYVNNEAMSAIDPIGQLKLKCVTGCVPAFVEIREDGGGGPTGFWVPAGVPAVLKPAWNQDVDNVFQRVKAACNGPGMVPPPIQWEIGQCTVGPWWDPTNTNGTTQPAWGSPRTIKICITTVGNPSNQSLAKRLKHELEHAYQACKSYQLANPSVPWNAIQTDWNDPDNMICREVNAYCAVAPAGTCKGAPGSLQPDGPQAANSVCGDACEILYDSQTQKAQHATCVQACKILAPSCVDGHK